MKLRLLCSFNVQHWFFSSQSQGCHIYLIFDGSALNQQLRKRNHIVKNYVLRLFTRSPLQIAVWYSIINYSLTCTCGKNEHSYSLMSLWSAYLDLCHLDYCHKLNWIICTLILQCEFGLFLYRCNEWSSWLEWNDAFQIDQTKCVGRLIVNQTSQINCVKGNARTNG